MHRQWLERLGGRPRPEGYRHGPSSGMALTKPYATPDEILQLGVRASSSLEDVGVGGRSIALFDQVRLWAYRQSKGGDATDKPLIMPAVFPARFASENHRRRFFL